MNGLRLTVVLLCIFSATIGCAKKKKSSGENPAALPVAPIPSNGGPFIPPGSGPGQGPGTNFQYGGTASITISSLSRMAEYTGRGMNNPTNVRLNLNLTKTGNSYGGTATIAYTDNNQNYEGYFTAGNSEPATKYNIWFSFGGKTVFHAFFEDFMGGLIIVIDDVVDLGDGGGPQDSASGSIWFKNFGLTYAPHPPTYCWFVSLGPYDCRAWQSGNGVNTTAAVNPDAGYKELGKFTGLSLKSAFNNEVF